jgi:hypothetical protein
LKTTTNTAMRTGDHAHRDAESLADSVQRLCRQLDIDRISAGHASPGWFTAAELFEPDSPQRQALLESEARRVGADRRTQGAFLIEQYAGLLGTATTLLYLGAGRVPDLRPEAVGLRMETYTWQRRGGVTGQGLRLCLRLQEPAFHVLPQDGESLPSQGRIVRGMDELRDQLRSGLQGHLEPLVAQIRRSTRLSPGAQWRLAADAIAAVFLDVGRRLGRETRAKVEAMALLKAPDSPLNNPQTSYMDVTRADRDRKQVRRTFRIRGGCCRIYTCDGGHYCSTCVLEDSESRYQRLQASLSG